MGKWRSGLKGWWQEVKEAARGTGKAVLRMAINLSNGVTKLSNGVLDAAPPEEQLEVLLGLICWGFVATLLAVRWLPLPEYVAGLATGMSLMGLWKQWMQRRSQQRSATAANVVALGGTLDENSGYEPVEWLNRLLKKAWPYVVSATEDGRPSIRDCLEPMLEAYRQAMYQVIRERPDVQRVEKYIPVDEVISSLHINAISLGTVPPVIEGVKINRLKEGKSIWNVRMRWQSDACVSLGVGTATGIEPINLENLKIRTKVRVIFHMMESPPFLTAIVTTIPADSTPAVDFELRRVPRVTKQLEKMLRSFIFDTLLWPHRLVLPMIPPRKGLDLSQLYLRLEGQLSVAVLKGEDLVNLYPYLTIYCRPEFKLRTKSIENTHDPMWFEEFTLDVQDQRSQFLTFQVMNENKGDDEFVGVVSYPLKDLPLDKDVELELNVQPKKKKEKKKKSSPENGTPENEEKEKRKRYGILTVELRYHVYTEIERESAIKAEEELLKALATPDEPGSYTTAINLIHP